MKYLCLVYLDEQNLHSIRDSECKACGDALRQNGHHLAAEALQPIHTATTVRVRNGRMSVTDGPFAETKEQLGGYHVVECRDIDEAIAIAQRIPSLRCGGTVEVRPLDHATA